MNVLLSRRLLPLPLSLFFGGMAASVGGCDRAVTSSPLGASSASDASPGTATHAPIPDADIAKAIQRHFLDERLVRSEHVQVAVAQGVATLSGTVSSLLASNRALAVAETIRGVRSVIDTITVTPVARTDDQLRSDVTSELQRDLATRPYAISVVARDGTVTLTGKADSWEQRHLFEDVAEAIPGVKSLVDDVTLHYSAARSDAEILTDVKHRLANDVWLDGDVFSVTIAGQTVHLMGTVGSVAEKVRARDDAWVAGVETVANDAVIVDSFARDDQRHITDVPTRPDADIAQAVRDALRIDPRLKTLVPEVAVRNGAVVLTGMVDSASARQAAAADARNTWGVWSVRNGVVVQPLSIPTDPDIERGAKRLLKDDLFLSDGQAIRVSSAKGEVSLSGTLGSGFERFDAIEDVESLPGVVEIDDELVVKRRPPEIATLIEDRLFWDPMVERDRVNVTVAPDGVATLTGTLDSWSEIRAAGDDSRLGGATRVINLLKLRNHPGVVAP